MKSRKEFLSFDLIESPRGTHLMVYKMKGCSSRKRYTFFRPKHGSYILVLLSPSENFPYSLSPVSTKSRLEQTPRDQLSFLLISFTNHYCYTKISSFMSGKPARKVYISIERSESLGEKTWATGEAVSVSRVTFHDSLSEARKTCYYTLLCRLKPYRYGCFEVAKALVTGNCLLKGPGITQIRGPEPLWGRDLTSFFFSPIIKKEDNTEK